jgi:transposase
MSAHRTDMHRIQELIRLHRQGAGSRQISRQLEMGRDTIRQYRQRIREAGLLDGPAEALPDMESLRAALSSALPPTSIRVSTVEAVGPVIRALYERGVGPTAIHDRLRLEHPEYAGSLSAVKRFCAALKRSKGPSPESIAIRVETAPGEVAQVDFTYTGLLYDPERRVMRKSWLFVMTLCYSRHIFAKLVFDQRLETWIRLHIAAFEGLRGVPRVIVPDNLKAAVIRAAFAADEDPAIQRSYRELARHYGFQIDPTPPRAPEKKGKVEANAKYVKASFFKGREPESIVDRQRALDLWVAEIAGQRIHGTTGRRSMEVFCDEEQGALNPLPSARYEYVHWTNVRVHRDSHVQIRGAFCSAPWRLVGMDLWAKVTRGSILLFHEDERIATHPVMSRGQRSTHDDHLPESRRDLRHRSRSYWIERAAAIGPQAGSLAEEVFGSDDVLLRLRAVQAIVTHLEQHPPQRAEAAAARARYFECRSYMAIENILRQGLDLLPLEEESKLWSRNSRFARLPHPS